MPISVNPKDLLSGGCIKNNDKANTDEHTYIRGNDGCLHGINAAYTIEIDPSTYDAAERVIAKAAFDGRPFTKTGKAGTYEHKELFPPRVRNLPRAKFRKVFDDLLEAKRIVQAKAAGSNITQWLDVPSGPFAMGAGVFAAGATLDAEDDE